MRTILTILTLLLLSVETYGQRFSVIVHPQPCESVPVEARPSTPLPVAPGTGSTIVGKEVIQSDDYFIVFVTKNCRPCERIKLLTMPAVRRAGFRIRTIDISAEPQWGLQNAPHVWRCNESKKMQSWTGFVSADILLKTARRSTTIAVTPDGGETTVNLERTENPRRFSFSARPPRMSFQEMIRKHNSLHSGRSDQSWTWPGGTEASLRRHLREVHGIDPG